MAPVTYLKMDTQPVANAADSKHLAYKMRRCQPFLFNRENPTF